MKKREPGEFPNLEARHEAHERVDKQKRYKEIESILEGKQLTAKQIAVAMYEEGYTPTTERNFSAPRLTELAQMGRVEIVGKAVCEYTGRPVSVYELREVV